jgi:hypothetical protein
MRLQHALLLIDHNLPVVFSILRILKQTTVPTEYGQLSFDDDGVRTHADFEILNLVPDADTNIKQWKVIRANNFMSSAIYTFVSSSHKGRTLERQWIRRCRSIKHILINIYDIKTCCSNLKCAAANIMILF